LKGDIAVLISNTNELWKSNMYNILQLSTDIEDINYYLPAVKLCTYTKIKDGYLKIKNYNELLLLIGLISLIAYQFHKTTKTIDQNLCEQLQPMLYNILEYLEHKHMLMFGLGLFYYNYNGRQVNFTQEEIDMMRDIIQYSVIKPLTTGVSIELNKYTVLTAHEYTNKDSEYKDIKFHYTHEISGSIFSIDLSKHLP
jgi:hypothetical protein